MAGTLVLRCAAAVGALLAVAGAASAWSAADSSYEGRDDAGGGGPVNSYDDYLGMTDTGTCIWMTDDAMTSNIAPPGFVFLLYGLPVDRIYIGSNGYLNLHLLTNADPYSLSPSPIPSASTPNGMVALNWEDLNPFTGGDLCYQTFGTAPERVFAVLYHDINYYGSSTLKVRALALLYEGTNLIEIHHNGTVTDTDAVNEALGIEDTRGTQGMQWEYGRSARTKAAQFRPLSVFPAAADDAYTLDWGLSHTLRVDGSGSLALPTANDGQLGHVTLSPVYADGLSSSESLTTLSGGVCGSGGPEFAADGQFCWTTSDADPCANSPYEFTYHTDDAYPDDPGSGDEATISITVTNCVEPPNAVDDAYNATEDQVLDVPAPGVLANDDHPMGLPILTTGVATGITPAGATVTLAADGAFTFEPPADDCSPTVGGFDYEATDGASTDPAHVTILITCTPDEPDATADTYAMAEDGVLATDAATGVRANDADVDDGRANADGNALDDATASLDAAPAHGVVTLAGNGSFTYRPDADWHGNDTFSYHLRDGNASLVPGVSATVEVTVVVAPVNDAPLARNDTYPIILDDTLDVPAADGVLGNDTDADGDTLEAVLVSGTRPGSVLVLRSDGSFTYTPENGSTTDDAFVYRARDPSGALSAPAVVLLDVSIPNPDLIARSDRRGGPEDLPIVADEATGLVANDLVLHPEPVTVVIDQGPDHGVLTLGTGGAFVYVPDPDFNGRDGFRYHLSQPTYGDSNQARVTLEVASVNDAPESPARTFVCVAEDGVLDIPEAAGLLALASDDHAGAPGEDDDPVRLAGYTTPALGVLTVDAATGAFRYVPAPDANGADAFTFQLIDARNATSAPVTASLCIDPVADPPRSADDVLRAYAGIPRPILAPGPLANDLDVDSATIRVAGAPLDLTGSAGGTLHLEADGSGTYTAPAGLTGLDTFAYRATDGALTGAPASLTFDVRVNTPPVADFSLPPRVTASSSFMAADLSHDIDAPLVSRVWDFGTAAPPGFVPPRHMYLVPGTYVVRLTVTDDAGASATAARSIVVDPSSSGPSTENPDPLQAGPRDYTNQDALAGGAEQSQTATDAADATDDDPAAPDDIEALAVHLGPDLVIDEGAALAMMARASGGTPPYAYGWAATPAIAGASSTTAALAATAPSVTRDAVHTVTVTVTDADGAVATATADVLVRNVPAPPSLALDPVVEAAPGPVALVAHVSGHATIAWRQLSGPAVVLEGATGAAPTFTGGPGTYVFEATATNADGSVSRQVTVHIAAAPAPGASDDDPGTRSVTDAGPGKAPWPWLLLAVGVVLAAALAIAAVAWRRRRQP